ncbi:ABC transporter ATP-binding protein/permease [Kitasatospora sp. NBC_01287]|uniref:ATP-binding cassette domain-containing protein n=1 Tax=Kitasatospora sp. NBC_01287 TaxID=2903573 RepID=UPI00225BC569|nr:ABC transporter ATP-binding protein [Kitasatospora sp. NBC_01287]MCX4744916.1 ABC transporter ATP-binding protein/permease [Kitasatospora sp. NBC_01287]
MSEHSVKADQQSAAPAAQHPEPQRPESEHSESEHSEEFHLRFPGDRRAAAAESMSTGAMVRRLPHLVRRALALAWTADPRSTVLLLVCQVLSGVCGAVALYATTGTLAALLKPGPIAGHLAVAAPSLSVLTAAAALRAVLAIAVTTLSGRVSPRIGREAELALIAAGCAAELEAYNEPTYNERWESADRGAATVPDLLTNAQDVIASTVSLVAAAGVLATLHPYLLPFLLLGSVPTGVAAVRTARIHYLASISTNEDRQALRIYRWFLIDKRNADQVRSDQIAPFMMAKYRAAEAKIAAATDQATTKAAKVSLVASLGTGAGTALIWGTLLYLVATGRIGLAAAGTAVFALRTASSGLQGMVGNGARLYRMGLYLDDLFGFLDEAGGHRIERGTVVPGAPGTVEVKGLSYTYPGDQQEPALRDVDMTLRRGEVVALIGQNGSGKTTLLKLLAGLYLPRTGSITWDGVPIADLDAEGLWRRVARVPQEYANWPLPAAENVHLGHGADDPDVLDAVRRAAEKTGFDEIVGRLRSGWRTLLAQGWWGGAELSGGGWQRAAVARALYRTSRNPGLLILDEPTSDLDPRAEHRILHSLRALAPGRITLLVTHNIANAAVADRVIVMDQGRVTQTGTWQELADQRDGLFRELLDLQRDRAVPGQRTAPE